MLECKKRRTIVHFGTDRAVLCMRARRLKQMGYDVVNADSGFEAIKLASLEHVDAVVLDLDRNHDEVTLVATEIKRCRPNVPTVLLVEGISHHRTHRLADALVPKRNHPEMLAQALESVLATAGREPAEKSFSQEATTR